MRGGQVAQPGPSAHAGTICGCRSRRTAPTGPLLPAWDLLRHRPGSTPARAIAPGFRHARRAHLRGNKSPRRYTVRQGPVQPPWPQARSRSRSRSLFLRTELVYGARGRGPPRLRPHWRGPSGREVDGPYVHKRFRCADFVTDGHDYWFHRGALEPSGCAALELLDLLNAHVDEPFRELCTTTVHPDAAGLWRADPDDRQGVGRPRRQDPRAVGRGMRSLVDEGAEGVARRAAQALARAQDLDRGWHASTPRVPTCRICSSRSLPNSRTLPARRRPLPGPPSCGDTAQGSVITVSRIGGRTSFARARLGCECANLPVFGPHRIRHSVLTLLAHMGVSPYAFHALARHARMAMTMTPNLALCCQHCQAWRRGERSSDGTDRFRLHAETSR